MDFDDVDAPQFVDFDLIKQGQDEGEGDEWFDTCIDEDNKISDIKTPITSKESSMTKKSIENKEPTVTMTTDKPLVATTTNESVVVAATETLPSGSNTDCTEEDVAQALNRMKRKPSERNAALKATVSIHSMVKSNKGGVKKSSITSGGSQSSSSSVLKSKLQTKEEYDLAKIKQIRQAAEKNKALSKKSFKTLYSKKSQPRPPSPKPLTEPKEFNFKTDERFNKSIREGGGERGGVSSDDLFPMNLRSSNKPFYTPNDPTQKFTPKGPTKVQPFKFQTEERLRSKIDHSTQEKFISSAEYTEKFEKKTPPRFRRRPERRAVSSERDYRTSVTVPKSPKLKSRYRSRSPQVMSFAEREEKYMEDLKKNNFKARPVPSSLYEHSGSSGVRITSNIPSTVPMSPNITKSGMKRTRIDDNEKEESREKKFKALPMPKDIFKSITGVPIKRPRETTVPHSPNITKKPHIEEKEEEPRPSIKPLPMPKSTYAPDFQPVVGGSEPHITLPVPFSFDNKYQSKDELIEQLVKKDEEELAKKREFVANKLPVPCTPTPINRLHTHTLPQPFNLMIDQRGELQAQKFTEKVEEMNKQLKDNAQFKASEPHSLYTKPFVPTKATKPLTEMNPFTLELDTRGKLRAKYDAEKQARENERKEEEALKLAMREKEEEEEIKALRKTLVHKAQPIHQYSAVNIQGSTKPVTCPISPKLSAITRNRTD